MFRRYADKDTETYRAGYPGWREEDDLDASENLKFYQNKRRTPSYYCEYIEGILTKWYEDYDLLESHHNYIQWLFPIPERGMWECQPLQYHEAVIMKSDPTIRNRLLSSYKMMLGFYGMELKDEEKGILQRSKLYKSRYQHLNYSGHNYLRITRILKCLGILGFEHFMFPFVYFVIDEMVNNKQLRNLKDSCTRYWLNIIRSEKQRDYLEKYGRKEPVPYFEDLIYEIPQIGIIEQHKDTEEDDEDSPALSRPNTTTSCSNIQPETVPTVNYDPSTVHSKLTYDARYDSDGSETVLDDYEDKAPVLKSKDFDEDTDPGKSEDTREPDHIDLVNTQDRDSYDSQKMEIDSSQEQNRPCNATIATVVISEE